MKTWILFLSLWGSAESFAHGGGEVELVVGPGKGVTEVLPDRSFKLAPEAQKRLEIHFSEVQSDRVDLPKVALAQSLNESWLFRSRNGWLKAVSYRVIKKNGLEVTVQSPDLRKGDHVVTNGVGFLRVIASQLGEPEKEDAHDDHGGHDEGEAHHDE